MGPMGPRGLGPWALWAPGALGPPLPKKSNYVVRKSKRTANCVVTM